MRHDVGIGVNVARLARRGRGIAAAARKGTSHVFNGIQISMIPVPRRGSKSW
jgi:hypothetical protein